MPKRRTPRPAARRSTPAPAPPGIGTRATIVTLAVLTAVHAVGLALIFHPIAGAFDVHPILDQDWGLHEFHLTSMLAFWHDGHRLWGYNPWFMAGYTSNTIQDLSVKLYELLAWTASLVGADPMRAFKLTILAGNALVPVLVYDISRRFDPNESRARLTGLVGACLALLYWWAGYPREMFSYGMTGWPLACPVALLVTSLWCALLDRESVTVRLALAWFVATVLLVPLHLESVFIVLLLAVPFAWRMRAQWRRIAAWTGATAAVVAGANAFWLLPFVRHLSDQNSTGVHQFVPLFVSADWLAPIEDYLLLPGGLWTFRETWLANVFRCSILALGLAGLALMRRERRDRANALAAGIVGLFLLTYFGSKLPVLVNLQPLRFKIAFDLALIVAAAPLLALAIRQRLTRPSRTVTALAAAGCIAGLLTVATTEARGVMQLHTVLPSDDRQIVDWIRQEAPPATRVLFEESGEESDFVYHGLYLSSFVPSNTNRALIGGPINAYNDRHFFAEFHSGLLCTHPIAGLSRDAIAAYLRLYNIGAIVAFSPESIQKIGSLPMVRAAGRVGPVVLFTVAQPPGWFLRGSGLVAAGFDGLHLSEVEGDVLLKFHWTADLRSTPSVALEPEYVLDDPTPFIRIRHPPDAFTIR